MRKYVSFSHFLILLAVLGVSAVSFSQTDTADPKTYPAANPYGMGMGMGGGIGMPPSNSMPAVIGEMGTFSGGEALPSVNSEAQLTPKQLEEMGKNFCAEPSSKKAKSSKTEADTECLECLNKSASASLLTGQMQAQELAEKIADQGRMDRELSFYKIAFGEDPLRYESFKIKATLEESDRNKSPLTTLSHSEESLPVYESIMNRINQSSKDSAISEENRKLLLKNVDQALELLELKKKELLKAAADEKFKTFEVFLKATTERVQGQLERTNAFRAYLASGMPWPPPESMAAGKSDFWKFLMYAEQGNLNEIKFWKDNRDALKKQLAAAEKKEAEDRPSLPLTKEQALEAYGKLVRSKLEGVVVPWGACGMSDAEIYAVRDYSGNGYTDLNKALRGKGLEKERYLAYRDILNQALRKMKVYQGQVVRGATLPPEVREQHQEGAVISYPSFTSTSLKAGFSGKDIFVIQSKSGHYIAPLAMAKSEQEVLFAADTKFKVISVTDNGKGQRKYIMEEVQ